MLRWSMVFVVLLNILLSLPIAFGQDLRIIDTEELTIFDMTVKTAKFQGIHIGGADLPMKYWPLIKIDKIIFDTSGELRIGQIVLIWVDTSPNCYYFPPVRYEIPPIGGRVEVFGAVWGYTSAQNGRYQTIYLCDDSYYMIAIGTTPGACPDLAMRDIWVEPTSFAPGQVVTIRFKAQNIGSANASPFKVALLFDGREIGWARLNGLALGKIIEGYKENFIWPSDTNCHKIQVILDTNNEVQECDENNNSIQKTFCPSSTPNMIKTTLTFELTLIYRPGCNKNNKVIAKGWLTRADTGQGLSDKKIVFSSDTGDFLGLAETDRNGYFETELEVKLAPGTYLITASFAGDRYYEASKATAELSVTENLWVAYISKYPAEAIKVACIRQGAEWLHSPKMYDLKVVGLPEGTWFGNFDVTEKGDKIVFSVFQNDSWDIFIGELDLCTFMVRDLKQIICGSDGREEDPKFSWDSQKIVFKKDGDIFVAQQDAQQAWNCIRLTYDGMNHEDWAPFFSPSGTKVVFTKRMTKSHAQSDEIFLASQTNAGWHIERLTINKEADWYPVFIDEEWIAFSQKPEWFLGPFLKNDDLVLMNLANRRVESLVGWWFTSEADPYPIKGTNYIAFISGISKYKLHVVDRISKQTTAFDLQSIAPVIFRTYIINVAPTKVLLTKVMFQVKSTKHKRILVINTPNPIINLNPTTFTIISDEELSNVEELHVQVFDLAGRKVWEGHVKDTKLVWDGVDQTGSALANGVYLYIARIKLAGEWIVLDPQKLVILR